LSAAASISARGKPCTKSIAADIRAFVHPEKPFDFAEGLLFADVALRAFVDQSWHIVTEDGSIRKIHAAWFD
jgi:hypothetical protein